MFDCYCRKAGIDRKPFDGKGFHGLRRRLAKNILVSVTPVTTIAPVSYTHLDVYKRQVKDNAYLFFPLPFPIQTVKPGYPGNRAVSCPLFPCLIGNCRLPAGNHFRIAYGLSLIHI